MKIKVIRYSSGKEATLGLMFIDGKFACYTLEDEFRTEKVYGETRIPAGTYEVKLRTVGGFNERYKAKFPDIHKGMLWLQDVPNFQYILIHIGNDDDDTAGCILVGNTSEENITKKGFIGKSTPAYKRIYPLIAEAIEAGVEVTIEVVDNIN